MFRYVDAGVHHVDRDRNLKSGGGLLELLDQFFRSWFIVVDNFAIVATELRIELEELLMQNDRVIMTAGEKDRLADIGSGGILDAIGHQVLEHDAVRVEVENLFIDLSSGDKEDGSAKEAVTIMVVCFATQSGVQSAGWRDACYETNQQPTEGACLRVRMQHRTGRLE